MARGPFLGISAQRLLRPNPPFQHLVGVQASGVGGRPLATGARHVHCQSNRAPLTAVWPHTHLSLLRRGEGGAVVFQKSNISVI